MMKPKILIVDDDLGLLNQLKWALDSEYEVLTASDKKSAQEIIHNYKPPLVALDINLTAGVNKEGLDILEEISSVDPFIKVIMITADEAKETALEAIAKGAFDYYAKPIEIEE